MGLRARHSLAVAAAGSVHERLGRPARQRRVFASSRRMRSKALGPTAVTTKTAAAGRLTLIFHEG